MNHDLNKIRKVIDTSESIVIAGHTNPDGDAIGACLGLAGALKNKGKQVFVLLEPYAQKYRVIPGSSQIVSIEKIEKADLFIALDCGDKERLGSSMVFFDRCETINIDHHKNNPLFARWNFVEESASSTSELVFHLLDGYAELNQESASALYAGMVYDTGGFRHSSTGKSTFLAVSKLLDYSVACTKIYESLFFERSFSEAKLLGLAIEKAERILDGSVIYSWITREELNLTGGTIEELDGIAEYMRSIRGVFVSVFFYEKTADTIKVSFRSEEEVDVSEIASKFGGGGHKKAAGCMVNLSMEKAISSILEEIKKEVCI